MKKVDNYFALTYKHDLLKFENNHFCLNCSDNPQSIRFLITISYIKKLLESPISSLIILNATFFIEDCLKVLRSLYISNL